MVIALPLKKHIIVGIDPGATFGIAALDLSGRKLAAVSTQGGFSDAARMIETYGTPSLVACDTNPAPEAALRIASYFSCRLFIPRESIREGEKNAVARGMALNDSHQRDAYCAAVFAFRSSANKLRQIDALDGLSDEEKEHVKHLLLRGYKVQDAFLLLREPGEKKEGMGGREPVRAKPASADELRIRLESLARENANLHLALERMEEEKQALLHRLRLLENGARQSVMRDSEFRKLRFRLQQAMNRLSWKGKPKQRQAQQNKQKGKAGQLADSKGMLAAAASTIGGMGEGINSLGGQEIDLERLVAEYRKGRK
jgi:predicted RNase H-like nuclease (RuvC/YqgF family)